VGVDGKDIEPKNHKRLKYHSSVEIHGLKKDGNNRCDKMAFSFNSLLGENALLLKRIELNIFVSYENLRKEFT
jgi:hypothetical protein